MRLLQKLTMDQPVEYQIIVKGQLDAERADWFNGMSIKILCRGEISITSLRGTVTDQAALHGILRKLYMLGVPIIEVKMVEWSLVESR